MLCVVPNLFPLLSLFALPLIALFLELCILVISDGLPRLLLVDEELLVLGQTLVSLLLDLFLALLKVFLALEAVLLHFGFEFVLEVALGHLAVDEELLVDGLAQGDVGRPR